MFLSAYLFGVDISGLGEVYKIFTDKLEVKYFYAYELIGLIFLIFLSFISLLTSFIIFFSKLVSKKEKVYLYILGLGAVFIIISNTFDVFRSEFNVFYYINFLDAILGSVVVDGLDITNLSFIKVPAFNLRILSIYVPIIIVFLISSIYLFDKEIGSSYKEKTYSFRSRHLLGFEIKKLVYKKSFFVFILLALVSIIPKIIYYYKNDLYNKKRFASYSFYEDEYKDTKKLFERKALEEKDLKEKSDNYYLYKEEMEEKKYIWDNYKVLIRSYKDLNSVNFYTANANMVDSFSLIRGFFQDIIWTIRLIKMEGSANLQRFLVNYSYK